MPNSKVICVGSPLAGDFARERASYIESNCMDTAQVVLGLVTAAVRRRRTAWCERSLGERPPTIPEHDVLPRAFQVEQFPRHSNLGRFTGGRRRRRDSFFRSGFTAALSASKSIPNVAANMLAGQCHSLGNLAPTKILPMHNDT
ncbi:MAG: hypothetical protein ACREF9_20950, partial [Opitutaceae bacterium]